MADTGFVLAGTGENIAVGSNEDWVNPLNVTIENDSTYAESDIPASIDFSDYLRASGFGFSVPSGATIDGVEVQVRRKGQYSGSTIFDESVYLCENGSIISGCTNKASATRWDNSILTKSYGGSTDTWNCSSLTPAIVNSTSFGVQLMAENRQSSSRWARVYWIKVKVYYTEAAGTTYQATVVSAGVGNATADARKPQKAVGNVAGSGDANADIRVAKQAESGSGGTSSAGADSKAVKRAEGEASGIGNAIAGAKLARRVESGSGGTGGASAGAKVSRRAEGGANGNGNAGAPLKRCSRAEGSAAGVGAANASASHVVNQVTYQAVGVSAGMGDASAVARLVRRGATVYDDLLRRSSRIVPIREGKVSLRPAGTGPYIDIGYCRIESDEPAAVTVKHALNGRRVIGYSDRLEISWLQTSMSEMAALVTLQKSEHDLKISRIREEDEGGGTEERLYEGYYLQLLPNLQRGRIRMILEKQISVAQMGTRMVIA